jgi:hypothetical protein
MTRPCLFHSTIDAGSYATSTTSATSATSTTSTTTSTTSTTSATSTTTSTTQQVSCSTLRTRPVAGGGLRGEGRPPRQTFRARLVFRTTDPTTPVAAP